MTEPPARKLSRARLLAFSVVTVVAVLLLANALVELLERRGILETRRPGDFVQHVDEALFEVEGDEVRKTRYARRTMVAGGFAAKKPADVTRMFIVGGSFAMGGPFADPTTGLEQAGTPASWLRSFLELGSRKFEVVNAGGMGQDSHRVRRVSGIVLDHEPDVLVVASCNNEAWMPETEVRAALRTLGGYRLMDRLLRPGPDARPLLVGPTESDDALQDGFEDNLRIIAAAARERGVPMLLATIPVNLRYSGLEREIQWVGKNEQNADCLRRGLSLANEGKDELAISLLSSCAEAPEAQLWLGLLELRHTGRTTHRSALEDELGQCVGAGLDLLYTGQTAEAKRQLEGCDNVHEALRWIGLAEAAEGNHERAGEILSASVDLFPRNRCRPAFNEVIRRVAAEEEGVTLVDVETAVKNAADGGLPGTDLFVDVCHMNELGYGIVAREVWRTLQEKGLVDADLQAPDLEDHAGRLGLQLQR